PGQRFVIAEDCELGDKTGVGLDCKELPQDVSRDSVLLLNDGLIKLIVEEVDGPRIVTRVILGGVLSNNKGINRQGGGLTAPALTAKDMDDVKTAAKLEADYLAVSFPKSKEDMYMARQLLRAAGGVSLLIAKIERAEAIGALAEICDEAEKYDVVALDRDFLDRTFTRIDQSVAMATLFTAFHLKVKAIAALTDSGSTALWMSRHDCGRPIYALTPRIASQRKMALY